MRCPSRRAPRNRLRRLLLAASCLFWLSTSGASAVEGEGQPITSSDYAVDLTLGPVLSTSRVTGLAGAATALAEGVEGGLSNPAAVAARSAGSADFWDYWLAFGVTYPFQNGDFYNSGNYLADKTGSEREEDADFIFLNTGGYLQLYGLGIGLNVELLSVGLQGASSGEAANSKLRLDLVTNHVQAGYLFLDGQLALAAGMQILRERVTATTPEMGRDRLQAGTGFGWEVGVLVRPNGKQWRAGVGFYSEIKSKLEEDAFDAGRGFVPPSYAVRPARGNIGFAYQFGERPLNPRWSYIEEQASEPLRELELRMRRAKLAHQEELNELRKRGGPDSQAQQTAARRAYADQERLFEAERAAIRKRAWRELRAGVRTQWSRRYLLLAGEVSFAGRVDSAVGLESMLVQTVQRSGERVSVTPRVGVESEVWPTHVKVRAGMYVEASRFSATTARPHGTLGVDVRLFNWDVFRIWPEDYLWQLSAAFDVSRDYNALSAGFGGWY